MELLAARFQPLQVEPNYWAPLEVGEDEDSGYISDLSSYSVGSVNTEVMGAYERALNKVSYNDYNKPVVPVSERMLDDYFRRGYFDIRVYTDSIVLVRGYVCYNVNLYNGRIHVEGREFWYDLGIEIYDTALLEIPEDANVHYISHEDEYMNIVDIHYVRCRHCDDYPFMMYEVLYGQGPVFIDTIDTHSPANLGLIYNYVSNKWSNNIIEHGGKSDKKKYVPDRKHSRKRKENKSTHTWKRCEPIDIDEIVSKCVGKDFEENLTIFGLDKYEQNAQAAYEAQKLKSFARHIEEVLSATPNDVVELLGEVITLVSFVEGLFSTDNLYTQMCFITCYFTPKLFAYPAFLKFLLTSISVSIEDANKSWLQYKDGRFYDAEEVKTEVVTTREKEHIENNHLLSVETDLRVPDDCYARFCGEYDAVKLDPPTEDVVEHSHFVDGVRAFLKSVSFKHVGVLLTGLATVGFVSPRELTICNFKLFSIRCLNQQDDGLSFMDSVLAAIDFFLESGWECFKQQSLMPMFTATDAIGELTIMVSEANSGILAYMQGNYKDNFRKDPSHYDDLLVRISTKMDVAARIYTQPLERKQIIELRTKFYKVNEQYLSHKRTLGVRVAPLCVKLFGDSSVGKSTVSKYVSQCLLEHNVFPCKAEHTVTIDTNTEWDSNMRSNVSCYLLDDLANSKANVSKRDPAETVLRIVNNVIATANMPCAEDKGKILIQPKVLMITTNNDTLDASYWSVNQKSVIRRMHIHVNVKVRPAYQGPNKELVATPGDHIDDYWLIDIMTAIYRNENEFLRWEIAKNPIDANDPLYSLSIPTGQKMENISIFDYLRFTLWFSRRHYILQNKIVNYLTNIDQVIDTCKKCLMPGQLCRCCNLCVEQNGQLPKPSFIRDIVFSTIKQHVSEAVVCTWNEVITTLVPGIFELRMLQGLSTIALLRYRESVTLIVNRFDWLSIVPKWVMKEQWFGYLYVYLRRKECALYARRAFCLTLPLCVVLLPFASWVNRFLLLTLPFTLSAFAYKKALQNIEDELMTRSNLVDSVETMERERRALARNAPGHGWTTVTKVNMTITGAIIVVVVFRGIRSFYQESTGVKEQGSLSPTSDSEIEQRDSEECAWQPVARSAITPGTMTGEQAVNLVQKNLWYMTYDDGLNKRFCDVFVIATGWLLMPYHVWFPTVHDVSDITTEPVKTQKFEFVRASMMVNGKTMPGTMIRKTLQFCDVQRVTDMDLCLVRVDIGGVVRDLRSLLPTREEYLTCFGQTTAVTRNKLGELSTFHGSSEAKTVSYTRKNGNISFRGGAMTSGHKWNPGECCTVLVSNTSSPRIVGFHLLGARTGTLFGNSVGYFASPLREEIDDMFARARTTQLANPPTHCGEIPQECCGRVVNFKPIMPENSVCRYIPPRYYDVLGQVGSPCSYSTNIKKSMIYDSMVEMFGPCEFSPPLFNREKSWRPFAVWLANVNESMEHIPLDIITRAGLDYVRGLTYTLQFDSIRKNVRPLTQTEIVNGIPGVRFIDSMNMNSAIGFPFSGPKRLAVDERLVENGVVRTFKDRNIMASIRINEEKYLAGESCFFLFKACLKDEVINKYKNGQLNEKIRVFTSCPIEAQLLIRKYFLPLSRVLSMFPLDSECAVGINCYGPEYQQMYDHVATFGKDRIVAGDYSAWDQKLSPQLMLMAFGVLIRLAQLSGNYSSDDLVIMEGIARDVCNPYVNLNGTLIQAFGSNPSGQNMTAYINSICNSILVRCCFFTHNPDIQTFRDHVKLITYGDDNEFGVAPSVVLDFLIYQEYLKDLGLKYTNAAKDDSVENTAFIHKDSASFLKRTPVYHVELGCHIGALEKKSSLKSLYLSQKSSIGPKNVIVSVMQCALFEMFAHGREEYEDFRTKISQICVRHNIFVPELGLSFDDRVDRWREKYAEPAREKSTLSGKDVPMSEDGYQLPASSTALTDYEDEFRVAMESDEVVSWSSL